MAFDIELTDAQVTNLAQAIALETMRAQTRVHEVVSQETAEWPESVKADVTRLMRDDNVTGAQLLDSVSRLRSEAARVAEREEREAAERAEKSRQALEEHQANVARTLEQNTLQNNAARAQWQADCRLAETSGRMAPREPEYLPETGEALAVAESRRRVMDSF